MACTLTTFTKAPMNITEGLRLGSGGESSLRDISSVGDTFNCSVTASAPIMKTSHRSCMKIYDRKYHILTLHLHKIYLPCFSALWVSTSIIFDRSIGRMTLKPFPSSSSCGDCWSPNRDDLSPSIDGVIAGDEVTDSWQSNRRWRWSDESLQLYRMTRPVKCIYHIQITKEPITQSLAQLFRKKS